MASQTLEGLLATNCVAQRLPILRPLIGMDKEDIVAISRKIGTFETSIEPYEDCCALFSPKHPKTKPKLPELEREEAKLDVGRACARGRGGHAAHPAALRPRLTLLSPALSLFSALFCRMFL